MASLALELGARQEQLVLETQSRPTFENAARCAELLKVDDELLLVSCDFHLARAAAHFRSRGLVVWPVPSQRLLTTASRFAVTSKELIALLRWPWLIPRL